MLLPKIASDFNAIGTNDFQFGGLVLLKYTKTKNLNYKFGLYTNTDFFGHFLVPLFGFYYLNSSEKFEAKVLLPRTVDLNYSIYKNMRLGIDFKGLIGSYNLNSPIEKENQDYLEK